MPDPVDIAVKVSGTQAALTDLQRLEAAVEVQGEKLRAMGLTDAQIAADPIMRLLNARIAAVEKLGAAAAVQGMTGLTNETNKLGAALNTLPRIATRLGIDELDGAIGHIRILDDLLRGLSRFGFAGGEGGILGGLNAGASLGIVATVGTGLAAVAALDYYSIINPLREIARLEEQIANSRVADNQKRLQVEERLIAEGRDSGALDQKSTAALLKRTQDARNTQQTAPQLEWYERFAVWTMANSALFANFASSKDIDLVKNLNEGRDPERDLTVARELKQIDKERAALTGPSQKTRDEGELQAAEAAVKLAKTRYSMEEMEAASAFQRILKSRTASEGQQLMAAEEAKDRRIEILKQEYEDEMALTAVSDRQLWAERVKAADAGDKDRVQQLDNRLAQNNAKREELELDYQRAVLQITEKTEAEKTSIIQRAEQKRDALQKAALALQNAQDTLALKRIQQNPSLSRGDRYQAGREELDEQLYSIPGEKAGVQRNLALTSDPQKKIQLQKELVALDQKELEIKTQIRKLDADNTFTGRLTENVQKLRAEWDNFGANAADVLTNTVSAGVEASSKAMTDAIFQTGNWSKAFVGLGEQAVQQLIAIIEKLLLVKALESVGFFGLFGVAAPTTVPGFASGGYTGDGPSAGIAGVVHYGETVIPAHVSARMSPAARAAAVAGDFGNAGGGPGRTGGGSVTNITFAGVHDTTASAIKGLSSAEGRKFLIDFNRQTLHEVTGKG